MLLNKRIRPRGEDGFTLVELLVTMLIVTVGLLGLAKLQATAVSNTSVARTRALMTYQAESLAGMIRSNQGFWVTTGGLTSWPKFAVSSAGVPSNTGMPSTIKSCVSATCKVDELARDDMYTWAYAFNDPANPAAAFPGASASIVCVPAPPALPTDPCGASPATPHGYDITLKWDQKIVAINQSSVNSASMTQPVSMVMHVQP